jgi:hypothetical protein
MLPQSIKGGCIECDGCGRAAPGRTPRGWFDRLVDPPYYSGPRRLLFCPGCFAALPASQQRRWRRLGGARPEPRLVTVARRFLPLPTLPRRGSVG